MRVILTAQAVADLTSIRLHISQDSPGAAERVGRRLVEACEGLAIFPNRGRRGLEPDTRENVSVLPYVIVYRVTEGEVQVLRVWHRAQHRA
jgi:plasmid stabilization system protein ParE